MCGIAGICNFDRRPIENILAMNRAQIRRGPDAGNYWMDESDKVVLGHRRLSIVELSDAGAQPMLSASGRYVLVYNGEIYNCDSLKKELQERRTTLGSKLGLRGTSDTEVLLESVETLGLKETLQLAKGMFAFALYDREEKQLFLSRDRMGEKPLYYGIVNNSFVFASDIGAIKAIEGFQNEVNQEVLGLYFRYGYIPQPYTIYRQIWQLTPGTVLKIRAPFTEWKQDEYWNLMKVAKRGQDNLFEGTEQEAAERLENLLKNAIAGQMRADVPLGAFLSGGIDSTLTVSLLQSLNSRKIRTFTVGFNEKGYNEAEYAAETARHLGTDHTELYVDYSDVMDVLPHLPEAYGEPFADSSQIPTMLISRLTREHVTVSLSGDAGDELFCGYNTYKDMENGIQTVKGKVPFLRGGIRRTVGKMCSGMSNAHTPLLYKAGNCFSIDTAESYYRCMSKTDCRIPYLGKMRGDLPSSNSLYPDGYLHGGQNNMMLMDMLQYLPDDILVKVDRAGMYYSLENRIPLLDRDVVEFAWTLPLAYKYRDGVTKKVLRNILYRYVPQKMMERPKKGFGVPVEQWLAEGRMREWAESIMTEARPLAGEMINLKYFDAIWKEYLEQKKWNPVIWYVLILEQWILYNRIG